jgi:uncharacterized protein (TIGR00730 family)
MQRDIKSIAVFCGSNIGDNEVFVQAAESLGRVLAERKITLIYGGTHKGLMGALTDALLVGGGEAHGVITQRLDAKGHRHANLTRCEVVDGMHARKARMLSLADACIALPGGIGTLEEFMEAWTLNQLGDIDKPVGLLNIEGFYDPLMGMIDMMIARKFLPAAHKASAAIDADPHALIDALKSAAPISASKWM